MKSITGTEFNNPDICIKGNGNFACVCKECKELRNKALEFFGEYLDGKITYEEMKEKTNNLKNEPPK